MNDRGTWYWMDSTGAMATGWIYDGSFRYYLDDKGNPTAQGWLRVDGNWHYFVDGRASTGWFADRGTWYRLDESTGVMLTGWQKVDGRWYYMLSSGALVTGWQSIGDAWYYMQPSGAMTVGWQSVGGPGNPPTTRASWLPGGSRRVVPDTT